MKQFYLTFISLLIIFTPIYVAQDSTKTDDEDWAWELEWDDVDDWIGWSQKKPTISLNYGLSNISRERCRRNFRK